jgi:hypothetical protein
MSDMGFPRGSRESLYLHTDQDLTHSRDITHIHWLSGYVLGHNSWRQLSYTNPHLWLGCCLLELCLARASSLSEAGLRGVSVVRWMVQAQAGESAGEDLYRAGPSPGALTPGSGPSTVLQLPSSVLHCMAGSLLQLA